MRFEKLNGGFSILISDLWITRPVWLPRIPVSSMLCSRKSKSQSLNPFYSEAKGDILPKNDTASLKDECVCTHKYLRTILSERYMKPLLLYCFRSFLPTWNSRRCDAMQISGFSDTPNHFYPPWSGICDLPNINVATTLTLDLCKRDPFLFTRFVIPFAFKPVVRCVLVMCGYLTRG